MKIKIVAVIIVAILLFGVAYVVITGRESKTTASFGEWSQKTLVTYADGSTEQLNMLLSSLTHAGKEITSIRYILSAKSSSPLNIDLKDYKLNVNIGPASISYTNTVNNIVPVAGDNSYHTIMDKQLDLAALIPENSKAGTSTLSIVPSGSVKYSTDNAAWSNTNLPGPMSMTVDIKAPDPVIQPGGNNTIPENQTEGNYWVRVFIVPYGSTVQLTNGPLSFGATSGDYGVGFESVPKGTYSLICSLEGYVKKTISVAVNGNTVVTIMLDMTPVNGMIAKTFSSDPNIQADLHPTKTGVLKEYSFKLGSFPSPPTLIGCQGNAHIPGYSGNCLLLFYGSKTEAPTNGDMDSSRVNKVEPNGMDLFSSLFTNEANYKKQGEYFVVGIGASAPWYFTITGTIYYKLG